MPFLRDLSSVDFVFVAVVVAAVSVTMVLPTPDGKVRVPNRWMLYNLAYLALALVWDVFHG